MKSLLLLAKLLGYLNVKGLYKMHCVVCVKQVPDTSEVKIDPRKNTLMREGVVSIINPFDEFAIEEALRIKDEFGGKVTAITMGPPQAEEVLKKCLAMGVDDVILLSDKAFAGSDTLATSSVLAHAIDKLAEVDLVFCGKQAIDGDTAQVGPGIARRLGMRQLSYVCAVDEVNPKDNSVTVQRSVEAGREKLKAIMPALLTVVKDINQPRFPSVLKLRRAQRAEVPVWNATDIDAKTNDIGLEGSPTQVVKIFTPDLRQGGEIIKKDPQSAVTALVKMLKRDTVI